MTACILWNRIKALNWVLCIIIMLRYGLGLDDAELGENQVIINDIAKGRLVLRDHIGQLKRDRISTRDDFLDTGPRDSHQRQYQKVAAHLAPETTQTSSLTVVTVFNNNTIYGTNTTIVTLATETNFTTTITAVLKTLIPETPIPEATNLVLDNVAYPSFEYYVNASSYALGGLLPITLDGVPTLAGVQYVEAFKCQLGILNSNRDILPHSYVTYTIRNAGVNSIPLSTGEAYEFSLEEYFMVIGPPESVQVPPIGYLYAAQNISIVSPSASSVDIGNATLYPSFFRTIPSDNFQARAIAETMRLFGWTFVAALFTNDAYGTSGQVAFRTQAGRNRIKVTCARSFTPGTLNNIEKFSDCVAASDANVVLLWSTNNETVGTNDAANVLSIMYQNATNDDLTFIASDAWAIINPDTFNHTIRRTGSSFPLSYLNGTLAFIPQIGQLGQYQACASQVNPSNTNYDAFLTVWESQFRCSLNDTDTIPPCPEDVSERVIECRCTGNENFADLPVDPLVNYVQDSVLVTVQALNSLVTPRNCARLKDPSICNLDVFSTSDYVQALSLVSVTGLTGSIQFNQTKPNRRRANFDIFQYNGTGEYRQVGFWNISGPFYAQNLLVFNTWPAIPVSVIVPDDTEFTHSFWPAFLDVIALIGIFVAIACLVFFTIFYKSSVIRRTNLLWLYLIFIGIILVLLANIIWTLKQSAFTCISKTIGFMFGVGLIVACIVVKTERIFRALINAGRLTMVLRNRELLIVAGIVLIPDILFIIAYIFGSGEIPRARITESDVDPTYVFITCTATSLRFNNVVVAIYVIYNAILVIACTICLLMARNLQTAYSEAFYLFLILLDFIIVCSIMIPLYYTVGQRKGSVIQGFLLRSLTAVFAMMLTVALLSYPKVQALVRRIKAKRQRRSRHMELIGSGAAPYTPVPETSDDSDTDSDFSTTSAAKPRFLSQTNIRTPIQLGSRSVGVASGSGGTERGGDSSSVIESDMGTGAEVYNITTTASDTSTFLKRRSTSASTSTHYMNDDSTSNHQA